MAPLARSPMATARRGANLSQQRARKLGDTFSGLPPTRIILAHLAPFAQDSCPFLTTPSVVPMSARRPFRRRSAPGHDSPRPRVSIAQMPRRPHPLFASATRPQRVGFRSSIRATPTTSPSENLRRVAPSDPPPAMRPPGDPAIVGCCAAPSSEVFPEPLLASPRLELPCPRPHLQAEPGREVAPTPEMVHRSARRSRRRVR